MAKILVVDDEKPIRSTLREILEFEKFQVDEAENGVQAYEIIQKSDFDVILCDIKMPKMDGLEFLAYTLLIHLQIYTPNLHQNTS